MILNRLMAKIKKKGRKSFRITAKRYKISMKEKSFCNREKKEQ
jgi:hypothetical protein